MHTSNGSAGQWRTCTTTNLQIDPGWPAPEYCCYWRSEKPCPCGHWPRAIRTPHSLADPTKSGCHLHRRHLHHQALVVRMRGTYRHVIAGFLQKMSRPTCHCPGGGTRRNDKFARRSGTVATRVCQTLAHTGRRSRWWWCRFGWRKTRCWGPGRWGQAPSEA